MWISHVLHRGVTVTYRVRVQYAWADARMSDAFDAAVELDLQLRRVTDAAVAAGALSPNPPTPCAGPGPGAGSGPGSSSGR